MKFLRRRPSVHRGWQDFELGTYITEPVPVERTKRIDILPDLQPWQEELLRVHGWTLRNQMLGAHRNSGDARISIHNAQRVNESLTVFGIPVRLDPRVPPGEVHVIDDMCAYPRIRAVHSPLPDGGWSVEEINEDAKQQTADFRRVHMNGWGT